MLLWGQGHEDRACGDAHHIRHFNALVQKLAIAMNKFKVSAQEQHELVAILAPLKCDIVQRRPRASAAFNARFGRGIFLVLT